MTRPDDGMQVCQRGHVVASSTTMWKQNMRNFCGQCGAATLVSCRNCDWPIEIQFSFERRENFALPYCPNYGAPMPWTEKAIADVNEYTAGLSLSPEERSAITATVEEFARGSDSPVVANRWKRLLDKVGPGAAKVLTDVASKVISEVMKGHLGY